VISINRFSADSEAEIALVKEQCKKLGVEALMADHWAEGGKGAADVARAVVKVAESHKSKLEFLYPDEMPLLEKIRTIAKEIYRAKDISADKPVRDQLAAFEAMGYGQMPGLHRQDAIQLLDQPGPQGRPGRSHRQCAARCGFSAGARSSWWRSGGEDHDHAGPPSRAGRRQHRRRAGRQDRGAVLEPERIRTRTRQPISAVGWAKALFAPRPRGVSQ